MSVFLRSLAAARASVPIGSERRLHFLVLTRFLHANRYLFRWKTLRGVRSHRATTKSTVRGDVPFVCGLEAGRCSVRAVLHQIISQIRFLIRRGNSFDCVSRHAVRSNRWATGFRNVGSNHSVIRRHERGGIHCPCHRWIPIALLRSPRLSRPDAAATEIAAIRFPVWKCLRAS
jgi:hypothetical protein